MLATYPTNLKYGEIEKRKKDNQDFIIKKVKEYMEKGYVVNDKIDEVKFMNDKSVKKAFRKIWKSHYLLENIRTFIQEGNSDYLINQFRQMDNEYGESWDDVYIFNTTDIEIVKRELENLYVQIDGSSWTSEYDCTGWAFYRPCRYYQLTDRIVVTQSGGLDV